MHGHNNLKHFELCELVTSDDKKRAVFSEYQKLSKNMVQKVVQKMVSGGPKSGPKSVQKVVRKGPKSGQKVVRFPTPKSAHFGV